MVQVIDGAKLLRRTRNGYRMKGHGGVVGVNESEAAATLAQGNRD